MCFKPKGLEEGTSLQFNGMGQIAGIWSPNVHALPKTVTT